MKQSEMCLRRRQWMLSLTLMLLLSSSSLLSLSSLMVEAAAAAGGTRFRLLHHSHRRNDLQNRGEKQELLKTLIRYLDLNNEDKQQETDRNQQHSDSHHHYYYSDPESGRRWMERTNDQVLEWNHRTSVADWDFITNITQDTQNKLVSAFKDYSKWTKSRLTEGRKFRFQQFDLNLRRQFQLFTLSSEPSDPDKSEQTAELLTTLQTVYNTATVCLDDPVAKQQHPHHDNDPSAQCMPLEPDLEIKMAESRDPEELRVLWERWREVAGKPQRDRYAQLVELLNEGARENGHSDFGEVWRKDQFSDDTDVEAIAAELWRELRPLYLELHAYVRHRLKQYYGTEVVGTDGTIPAHLLGNMWAQQWQGIYPLVTPYTDLLNASEGLSNLLKNKYDVRGLFQLSEEFYVSMGLFRMTDIFWSKSMFVKPTDREVQCHASAVDMYSPGDFRIKMCTEVTPDYLTTVHHEMGHVQYFMAYAHQPALFRDGANCAFHEAIGDTVALSVLSRTHLRRLGLTPDHSQNETKEDINHLMRTALRKIAFLPFGLLVDRWRWQVFSEQTTPDRYNYDWWKLRLELQGVRSPVPRSEVDFDPAAKMHVASNSPYICYFFSHVAQFQFYKTLCEASGHTGPLHLCDFGGSHKAGALFRKFMALGASRPWQDALETFTGSRKISAQPILEYFEPLRQWLKQRNQENGEHVDWDGATVNWQQS